MYYKNANRPGWANFNLDGSDRTPGVETSQLYHLDANSAATCAFIKRHHGQPFFFYCAYRAPHVPLDAPAKYLERFPGEMPERRRQALAMISAIDDGVGAIRAELYRQGLLGNTMILFMSDNGPSRETRNWLDGRKDPYYGGGAGSLRGHKFSLYEGGIRVPGLLSWPDREVEAFERWSEGARKDDVDGLHPDRWQRRRLVVRGSARATLCDLEGLLRVILAPGGLSAPS